MDQVLKLKTLLAQDEELRSRMSQEKAQPADVDISKVNAKISCEKKVTSQVALQPPDEGDSKMPAKRSPRSLEKAQPVEEGDSKVSTKKSRKSQKKAQQADVDISKVNAKKSRKKKVTSQPADEDNSKMPAAKRSRKSQKKAQPADVDISNVSTKISRKKKVTSQPADEDDSKVPAKRSRQSQEKAKPVEEGDSKVSTKKSRKSQEKALQILSIKVGHHLSLYWPNDGKWYKATVTSKDSADSNRVSLLYTDGEVEIDVDLFDEQFEIVTGCNSTKTQSKNSPESDLGSESLKSKTVEVCFIGLNVN
jgi:hypothetical protein